MPAGRDLFPVFFAPFERTGEGEGLLAPVATDLDDADDDIAAEETGFRAAFIAELDSDEELPIVFISSN